MTQKNLQRRSQGKRKVKVRRERVFKSMTSSVKRRTLRKKKEVKVCNVNGRGGRVMAQNQKMSDQNDHIGEDNNL